MIQQQARAHRAFGARCARLNMVRWIVTRKAKKR